MKRTSFFTAAVLLGGCRDPGRSSEAHARAANATPRTPSFRRDILPVFDRHCSSAKGCHGAEPTDSVDLDLRAVPAYAQLVNHPAEARKGALRVKPGDIAASFLVDKLKGAVGAREGKPMPIDADTGAPIEPSPLPPVFIAKVLGPWILAGAPEN